MKIYIVTDGAYDDYNIKAVFTNKRQAELYCAENEYENIEEWDADTEKSDTNIEPKKLWIGRFWADNGFEWDEIKSRYTCRDIDRVEKSVGVADVVVEVTLDVNINEKEAKQILLNKYAQWKDKQSK